MIVNRYLNIKLGLVLLFSTSVNNLLIHSDGCCKCCKFCKGKNNDGNGNGNGNGVQKGKNPVDINPGDIDLKKEDLVVLEEEKEEDKNEINKIDIKVDTETLHFTEKVAKKEGDIKGIVNTAFFNFTVFFKMNNEQFNKNFKEKYTETDIDPAQGNKWLLFAVKTNKNKYFLCFCKDANTTINNNSIFRGNKVNEEIIMLQCGKDLKKNEFYVC